MPGTHRSTLSFTARPVGSVTGRPIVNAPVGVTGFVVAFALDNKKFEEVDSMRLNARLLAKLDPKPYVYFAHSYYVPETPLTAATCNYCVPYTAVLDTGNIFGVQFHPEKSGLVGLRIVKNFVEL